MLKRRALAAGHVLTHQTDPYLRLLGALQTSGSPRLDFSRDIAPWLGQGGGIFLSSFHGAGAIASLLERGLLGGEGASFPFNGTGAQGAIVLDTTNAARARAFLRGQAARAGAHPASYEGFEYQAGAGGVAFALLDRLAVIGSEGAVRSVIHTIVHGGALTHSLAYAKLLDAGPPQPLAHVYFHAPAAAAAGSSEGASALAGALAGLGMANISLVPAPREFGVDIDTAGAGPRGILAGPLAFDPQAAQGLDELPGESWLAIGLGHLERTIGADAAAIQTLASLFAGNSGPSPGISLGSLVGGLLTPLRVLGADTPQARHEFASWMGSAGVFASGASLLELKAAVVISSTNAAASRAAVAGLAGQLRRAGATIAPMPIPGTEASVGVAISGLPVRLAIADGRDAAGQSKFVIGVGEASVPAALNPPSTMAASATRSAAATRLGEGIQPSVILQVPSLLEVLEGVGLLEQQPAAQLLPYLRSTTTLVAGARTLGGSGQRFRAVLSLPDEG